MALVKRVLMCMLALALVACSAGDHFWRKDATVRIWTDGRVDEAAMSYRSPDGGRLLLAIGKGDVVLVDIHGRAVGSPNESAVNIGGAFAVIKHPPLEFVRFGTPKTDDLPEPIFTNSHDGTCVEFISLSRSKVRACYRREPH